MSRRPGEAPVVEEGLLPRVSPESAGELVSSAEMALGIEQIDARPNQVDPAMKLIATRTYSRKKSCQTRR